MKPDVIVIDDDYDSTEVLSEFLRLKSINVLATGHNGKEAVELYKKYSPDVVLMDFLMPDFDGLYGLENILKINPNAHVVILTGSTEDDTKKKLTDAGVFTIMQKPYNMNGLIETIDKISLGDTVQLYN